MINDPNIPTESASPHAEWTVQANRIAPLVDGVEYFGRLRESLLKAERQVMFVGWELHSEIELLRGEEADRAVEADGWPVRLADLLEALVEAKPKLHIYLLIWEGQSLFALERQQFPRMTRPWAKHERITLKWARDTPRLASHHQKFVVVDDAMAYAGGIDMTSARWDTHEHARDDDRRKPPYLLPKIGQPYHDIMLAFDGEAAKTLGDFARERWRWSTGEGLTPACDQWEGEAPDRWPDSLKPALLDRDLSIALTQPAYGEREEKRQIEASYLAQFAQAKRFIFLENQYLTCGRITEGLRKRLSETGGPEVIIVLPYGCPGVPQAMGMDPRRDALLDTLREADHEGRLGVFWPAVRGEATKDVYGRDSVYVHAKTLVVDDRLLRIGSANLNNRSMGLDTELDVYLTADDDAGVNAIGHYRRRLIAYLMHTDPNDVLDAEEEQGSVVGAIRSLQGGEHTLHDFDHRAGEFESNFALPIELADPDRPLDDMDVERILAALDDERGSLKKLRGRVSQAMTAAWSRPWTVSALGALLVIGVLVAPTYSWLGYVAVAAAIALAAWLGRMVMRAAPGGRDGVEDLDSNEDA